MITPREAGMFNFTTRYMEDYIDACIKTKQYKREGPTLIIELPNSISFEAIVQAVFSLENSYRAAGWSCLYVKNHLIYLGVRDV